jgi:hypothetical protein
MSQTVSRDRSRSGPREQFVAPVAIYAVNLIISTRRADSNPIVSATASGSGDVLTGRSEDMVYIWAAQVTSWTLLGPRTELVCISRETRNIPMSFASPGAICRNPAPAIFARAFLRHSAISGPFPILMETPIRRLQTATSGSNRWSFWFLNIP